MDKDMETWGFLLSVVKYIFNKWRKPTVFKGLRYTSKSWFLAVFPKSVIAIDNPGNALVLKSQSHANHFPNFKHGKKCRKNPSGRFCFISDLLYLRMVDASEVFHAYVLQRNTEYQHTSKWSTNSIILQQTYQEASQKSHASQVQLLCPDYLCRKTWIDGKGLCSSFHNQSRRTV